MAREHTAIENPVTGERIEFRETADETVRFDYYLTPGGFATGKIDHVHPHQEERFEVRSGRLSVRIDGDEWTATPGTRFAILPETAHTVWNDGDDVMHAAVEIRPALEIKAFFETAYGLASEGETNRWGIPGPLQSAVLVDVFRDEIYFDAVPVPVQRALSATLAPIGRVAGYRARYSRHGDPSA